jgi:hypothetical protein
MLGGSDDLYEAGQDHAALSVESQTDLSGMNALAQCIRRNNRLACETVIRYAAKQLVFAPL